MPSISASTSSIPREAYGPFENEILLGKALGPLRDTVTIATKFGFKIADQGRGAERLNGVDSRPEHVKAVAEASLKWLGIEVIDLYYQHRVDPSVPIEDTVGAMAELVLEGKVRALGLSEASAKTICRAHAVHPIAAVQSEYSLWTRDPEESVLDTCRELGIGFVPYSPLGRGLLTGTISKPDQLDTDDWRRAQPRFQAAKIWSTNAALIAMLERLAADKQVTAGTACTCLGVTSGRFYRANSRRAQDKASGAEHRSRRHSPDTGGSQQNRGRLVAGARSRKALERVIPGAYRPFDFLQRGGASTLRLFARLFRNNRHRFQIADYPAASRSAS